MILLLLKRATVTSWSSTSVSFAETAFIILLVNEKLVRNFPGAINFNELKRVYKAATKIKSYCRSIFTKNMHANYFSFTRTIGGMLRANPLIDIVVY